GVLARGSSPQANRRMGGALPCWSHTVGLDHARMTSRRSWLIALPFGLVVVLAAAWTAFWFFASSRAEVKIAEWRAQQERIGRTYTCAKQTIGGFPFRLEVRCTGAQVELT